MVARFRSWWQTIRKLLVAVGIIAACTLGIALIVGIIGGYFFNWNWTGLRQKTLWDWLQLLIIPAILTLGAVWFTSRQNHDREIAEDNQRQAALQAYLDKMSELLLEKDLRQSQPGDEVRTIANVRTLTLLPKLDPLRKRTVIRFLDESSLLNKDKDKDEPIVDLSSANLRYADLHAAILLKVDMHEVDFRDANLRKANLSGSDLRKANLDGAEFSGADLSDANLEGATGLTIEELKKQAKSLKGATMPDGSKHP